MKLLKRPLFRAPAPKPAPKVTKLNVSASRAASRAELEDYSDEYAEEDMREPNMRLTHAFIVVLVLHVIAVGGVFGYNAMKTRQAAAAKAAAVAPVAQTPAAPVEATAPVTQKAAATPAPVAVAPVKPIAPVAAAPVTRDENRDIIPGPTAPATVAAAPGTYQVMPGDTLSRIASRNGTNVDALEKANGLTSGSVLRVGQVLQLPNAGKAAPAPVVAKTEAPAAPVPAAPVKTETAKPAPAAATATDSGEIYVIAKGDNPYSIAKKLKVSYQALIEVNGITDPTKLQIGQKLKIPVKP